MLVAFVWKGEHNRPLNLYRPCHCVTCKKSQRGVGYLSVSDSNGRGMTVWIQDESAFRRLWRIFTRPPLANGSRPEKSRSFRELGRLSCPSLGKLTQTSKTFRPTAGELCNQVRRAACTDQLEVLRWLQRKFPNEK